MERFVIDVGIFTIGVAVGYLVGNRFYNAEAKAEPAKPAEMIEPTKPAEPVVSTETTVSAEPVKKKKKRVVLTPSVA